MLKNKNYLPCVMLVSLTQNQKKTEELKIKTKIPSKATFTHVFRRHHVAEL